ncbi:DUF1287 domain-containing protein [Metapseudomonas otitidis]|uniref:DUF1287 domain-containing protein n=1 Tax=Metapseudomonas otitidis TaxID=319939 RepID=UPI003EDFEBAF
MCSKAFRFVLGIGLWWFCLAGWAAVDGGRLVEAARTQVGVTLGYDPAYRRIAYPGGDVPLATGVCTDVVIRALRSQGLDLQQRVHEDMRRHFSAYPRHWGLKRPDPNIDHRRVPNLMTWFDRQGLSLKVGQAAADYQPGDIVTWDLGRGLQHIGIISDRRSREGTPLALHNIGQGTREEDILFRWPILGHYRFAAH